MGAGPAVAVLLYKDSSIYCADALNTVRMWAERGYRADLLAFDNGLYALPEFSSDRARVVAVRTLYGRLLPLVRKLRGGGRRHGAAGASAGGAARPPLGRRAFALGVAAMRSLQKLEFYLSHTFRLLRRRYSLAIACDLPSLLVARTARALRGTPYLYHSRELALSWDERSAGARIAKILERRCHRSALLTIAQDERRAELLARDNRVPRDSFLLVPNAPIGTWAGGTAVAGAGFSTPAGKPVVLYAGGVTPETMVLEIVQSMAAWPAEAVLVIHGAGGEDYMQALRAAAAPHAGRVVFSTAPLPVEEVDRVYALADVGLAFYRPINDNFRFVGCASGKIFNLMKVGVPVVANDLPGMRALLDETGCGRVVADPAGIGDAIADLLGRRELCRARCAATFPRYEFARTSRDVISRTEAALRR